MEKTAKELALEIRAIIDQAFAAGDALVAIAELCRKELRIENPEAVETTN